MKVDSTEGNLMIFVKRKDDSSQAWHLLCYFVMRRYVQEQTAALELRVTNWWKWNQILGKTGLLCYKFNRRFTLLILPFCF